MRQVSKDCAGDDYEEGTAFDNGVARRAQAPAIVRVRLGAGVTLEGGDLTPALAATLKHAASMPNPVFYERQRRRASTWNVPRFVRSYDETRDGGLILPRGLLEALTDLIEQLGSCLEVTDHRVGGDSKAYTFSATLDDGQQAARKALSTHDLGVLVAPPEAGKTVIACALTADHATSTLILVDRKALADQWRRRISELAPGSAGRFDRPGLRNGRVARDNRLGPRVFLRPR